MSDIDALFSLEGKSALITGASGGLGLHFARVLHDAGAHVVLAARRIDRIEAEAKKLGERAAAVSMDVSDEASIIAGFDHITSANGPPDIIVNNAGASGSSFAMQMPAAEWDGVMAVNLRGPFLVAREAAQRLTAAKRTGSIINISSVLGFRALPSVAAYMASKAGLLHLTRSLALEFARFGIRVNAICPGYFHTELSGAFLESDAGKALLKRVPQRRLGQLEDLTGPLLLLASAAGGHMTGSMLVVDGGHSIGSL